MIEINREELAWAGGFFSGEGTSGTRKVNTKWRAIVTSIHQCHRPNLERFSKAIGNLGFIQGPEKAPSRTVAGRKPIYKWYSGNFEHCQAVIAMLWPWLSQEKRDQATNSLSAMSEYHKELAERKAQRG